MTVLRRTFIKSAAMTALSAAFVVKALDPALGQGMTRRTPTRDFPIPYEATLDPVFRYTQETFEPYVGGIFRSRARGEWIELTLVSVNGYEPKPDTRIALKKGRATDTFSLTFRATDRLSEITTIHELEHGALGKFGLYLTPSEDARGQLFYVAVINHTL